MTNLQKQFEKFHREIKVETEELREKRDIIINKIKDSLNRNGCPVPELFNQGSYIYGVGIKPISNEQEYDIDVGLIFNIRSDEYSAKEVRMWVYDAIGEHTQNVEEKGPCIRVRYQAGYHVDLICYSLSTDYDGHRKFKFAHKSDGWKEADPEKLKSYIKEARRPFENSRDSSGVDQLQRVVRYLKRWNDKALPDESEDKPVGLALLLLCIKHLITPIFDSEGKSNDLEALRTIIGQIKSLSRISVKKPTPEYEDVFEKIGNDGMLSLIGRFKQLDESLFNALNESDLEKACKIIRCEFGNDFPLEKDEEKSATVASIIASVEATKPYAN